jgi:hypothetical protein
MNHSMFFWELFPLSLFERYTNYMRKHFLQGDGVVSLNQKMVIPDMCLLKGQSHETDLMKFCF